MGFIRPARIHAKNRLYSAKEIERVRQIQRLTQDLGVNLAGVEVILNLLDQIDEMKAEMETQMADFVREAEDRINALLHDATTPVRKGERLLPIPRIVLRRKIDL
jgi:MerR family transcriptional regulator/heat shock protein HspR